MSKRSMLLLHQPSIELGEVRSDVLHDKVYNLDLIYDRMIDLYVKHSHLSVDQVNRLISDERYLTAQEAKNAGLVDVISP